jgi:hypothetical protein
VCGLGHYPNTSFIRFLLHRMSKFATNAITSYYSLAKETNGDIQTYWDEFIHDVSPFFDL